MAIAYDILLNLVNSLPFHKTLQKDLLVELKIGNRTDLVDVRGSDFIGTGVFIS